MNGTVDGSVRTEQLPVSRRVLVVGGGIAGLETVSSLVRLGFDTTLVENTDSLGGNIDGLFSLYGIEEEPARLIESGIETVRTDPRVTVMAPANIVGVEGSLGNLHVRIECAGEISEDQFGAIVVATGFELEEPSSIEGFAQKVVSHSEFAKRLADLHEKDRRRLKLPENICFIVEDVGEDSPVHSASALSNALAIKRLANSNVFVCCQNVNVANEGLEELYDRARSAGVVFFKFDEERPVISGTDTGLKVTVRDSSAARHGEWKGLIEIECDLVVLPQRIIPRSGTDALQSLLQVNLDSADYFQENNIWLKPTASNRKGIFFVGGCRGSFNIGDILTEARATALEVYNLIGTGEASVTVGRVSVDVSKCALCLTCVRSCPHGAVEVVLDDATGGKAARIIDIACNACGICVAECPAKAIQMVVERSPEEPITGSRLATAGV